ncbi:Uncharacterised protein [Yersinia intermedia]|uniref:Uncharacterized protein n=1 Tax=Yersinia intermedia TaxID=631 RepID=A0A0H5LSY6_YERIN|nr:Uncharacterised protein [Yersinia intermedia]
MHEYVIQVLVSVKQRGRIAKFEYICFSIINIEFDECVSAPCYSFLRASIIDQMIISSYYLLNNNGISC